MPGVTFQKGAVPMLQDIFDPDNLFFRTLSKGVDFVGLSLLWVLLCMPVITIGSATAALYYTVVKVFCHKKDGAFGMYLKAFKENLRSGIPVTVISILAALFLAWGHSVMANHISTSIGVVMYMIYYVFLLIPAGVICYALPLMGRFEFQWNTLFQTAFVMSLKHLPSTVVIVMLTVEMSVFTIEKWWPVLFTPVLTTLLISLFLERIFSGYLGKDEMAVLESREEEKL